jgi:hypothetical protein
MTLILEVNLALEILNVSASIGTPSRNDCARAMRKERLEVFLRPRVVAYVRVAVNETRRHVTLRGIQDVSCAPLRMLRAPTAVANSPVENGNLDAVQNLAGIDVNEFTAGNDKIGFDLAHGVANESSEGLFRMSHAQVFNSNKQRLLKPILRALVSSPHWIFNQSMSNIALSPVCWQVSIRFMIRGGSISYKIDAHCSKELALDLQAELRGKVS